MPGTLRYFGTSILSKSTLREVPSLDTRVGSLPMLSMSSAVRLFGLTPRALRFYEEKGLLSSKRDRQNSRWYDGEARGRIEWIARLRRADLSLADIREILLARDRGEPIYDIVQEKVQLRRIHWATLIENADAVLASVSEIAPHHQPVRRQER